MVPVHTSLTTVGRSADLRLRGRGGPVGVRVRWPAWPLLGSPPPVVVVLADPSGTGADDAFCDALCAGLGALVLHVFWAGALERAADALDWAADHAAELDGDPERVLVAGRGQAAVAAGALAQRATDNGWPPLAGQVLVVWQPWAGDHEVTRGATAPAAATIVTSLRECSFSARLRAAGADVSELVDPRVDPSQYPEQPFLPALTEAVRQSLASANRSREENDVEPTLAQGDLRLLETELAKQLLGSRIPARYAFIGTDGKPRVVASWFRWTGSELVMPTFLEAPHIRHQPYRVRALRANPDIEVSIDTESFPPQILTIRGVAELEDVDGVDPDYAAAARQFLGEEAAADYLQQIEHPETRMARISVRPRWVGLLDFASRLPSALGGVSE
jgi:hypothetical protein